MGSVRVAQSAYLPRANANNDRRDIFFYSYYYYYFSRISLRDLRDILETREPKRKETEEKRLQYSKRSHQLRLVEQLWRGRDIRTADFIEGQLTNAGALRTPASVCRDVSGSQRPLYCKK